MEVIEESALMLRATTCRGKNNGAWAWNLLTRRCREREDRRRWC